MQPWMIHTIMRVCNMSEEEVLALPWESQLYLFYGAYFYEQLTGAAEENGRSGAEKPKQSQKRNS